MQVTTLTKNAGKTVCFAIMAVFFFMLAGGETGLAALDITDTNIEIAVDDALMQDQAVSSYVVDVACANGVVTLSGSVDNILAKDRALAIAETVKGVRSVINRIEVNPLTEKTDPDIRTDVILSLAGDPVTELFDIDVRVDDKAVTLKGMVNSHIEKQAAEKYLLKPDDKIKEAVDTAISKDPRVLSTKVDSQVDTGGGTLSGKVNVLSAKQAAAQDARNTVGVIRVKNRIKVTPSVQADTRDELEQKILNKFERDVYVDNLDIAVTAPSGIVNLYGTVDSFYEKARAEDLAASQNALGGGAVVVDNELSISSIQ